MNFDGTKQEGFFLNWSVVILSLDLSNDNVPVNDIIEKMIIMKTIIRIINMSIKIRILPKNALVLKIFSLFFNSIIYKIKRKCFVYKYHQSHIPFDHKF